MITGTVYHVQPPKECLVIADDGNEIALPYSLARELGLWIGATVALRETPLGLTFDVEATLPLLGAQREAIEAENAAAHEREVTERMPLHVGYHLSNFLLAHPELTITAVAALLEIEEEEADALARCAAVPALDLLVRMNDLGIMPDTLDLGQTPGEPTDPFAVGALYILNRDLARRFEERLS